MSQPPGSRRVPLSICLRAATAARATGSMTPGRWYVCDAVLALLASALHEVTRACLPSLAGAGEAGDLMDVRSPNGFHKGHRRQHSNGSPCQHRLARPEITFHCRRCRPLRAPALHGSLQGSEPKAPSRSDRDRCRLTCIRPVRPKRPP
jgi:hypothetical protein